MLLLCRKISQFFTCILRLGFAWLSYDGVLSSIFHYPAQWTCRFFMLRELCLTSKSIYRRPGKESLTTHLMLTHILTPWTNKEWKPIRMRVENCAKKKLSFISTGLYIPSWPVIGKGDCSSRLKASPSNTEECLLIFGLHSTTDKKASSKTLQKFSIS